MNTGLASTSRSVCIPDEWSPEQALAVYELLNEVVELIWERYELQLIELIRSELVENDTSQLDLFDFDDDIPF